MAWTATIQRIEHRYDTLDVRVAFSDGVETFTKFYNFHRPMAPEALQSFADEEASRIDEMRLAAAEMGIR